jgi:chromosome segregation ATPase
VNDFETVRAAVERDEPISLPRRDEDARAALDRIEAEVERLKREREEKAEHPPFENLFTTIRELEAEVERLTAGREEDLRLRVKWQDKLTEKEAEVERLRAENERYIKTLREWQEGYPGKLIAEVERLTAENSELGSHFSWEQDSTIPVCPYESAVKRLQDERDYWRARTRAALAKEEA